MTEQMREAFSGLWGHLRAWFNETIRPVLRGWWKNPLFHHARRSNPMPKALTLQVIGGGAVASLLVVGLAWALNIRLIAALMAGISLAPGLLMVVGAPFLAADRLVRLSYHPRNDPRLIEGVEAREVTWGLALATLWRMRWLIVIALMLTPALIISVMRLDLSDFATWRDSAAALGVASGAVRTDLLRPDGAIPLFRVGLRAVSAGLMPWLLLPLATCAGLTAGLLLDDISLSPLSALIVVVVCSLVIGLTWHGLTRTGVLGGGLEVIRLLLVVGLDVGLLIGANALNGLNASWLREPPEFVAALRSEQASPVSTEKDGPAAAGSSSEKKQEKDGG